MIELIRFITENINDRDIGFTLIQMAIQYYDSKITEEELKEYYTEEEYRMFLLVVKPKIKGLIKQRNKKRKQREKVKYHGN